MAQDLYEILEIPPNATDTWIRRAYDRKRNEIAQDAGLSDADRQALQAGLDNAFATLSNPASRERYDAELLAVPAPVKAQAKKTGLSTARVLIYGGALALLIGTGWVLWKRANFEEQQRIEQERAAAEVAARMQDVNARDKAQRDSLKSISGSVEKAQLKQQAIDAERAHAEEEEAKKEKARQSKPDTL